MNNKINDFNTKDQLFKDYQEQVKNANTKKAINLFKDLYFHQEYKSVYFCTHALKFIANILSSLTLGVALWLSLSPILGQAPTLAISTIACITLEILKNKTWNITTKKALKYKEYSLALISTLVILHAVSLSGSILGAWHLPSLIIQEKQSTFATEKVDTTQSTLSNQIALIDTQIKDLSKSTKSSTIRITIRKLTEQKQELIKAQNLAIERANTQKDTKRSQIEENAKKEEIKHKESVFKARVSCIAIAILFELIYIACALFIAYYLFRLFIDITLMNEYKEEEGKEENDTTTKHDPTPSAETGERPHRVVINAFKNSTPSAEKLEHTKVCALNSCKKPFIHNVHNQEYCTKSCRQKANYQKKKKQKSAKSNQAVA